MGPAACAIRAGQAKAGPDRRQRGPQTKARSGRPRRSTETSRGAAPAKTATTHQVHRSPACFAGRSAIAELQSRQSGAHSSAAGAACQAGRQQGRSSALQHDHRPAAAATHRQGPRRKSTRAAPARSGRGASPLADKAPVRWADSARRRSSAHGWTEGTGTRDSRPRPAHYGLPHFWNQTCRRTHWHVPTALENNTGWRRTGAGPPAGR